MTLAWSAGEEDAPYDVSLSVRNPERPARWTIDGLAWMPAVALIENGGALLERVLAAFGVAASDGALVALRDRLHDKMAVDSGVEPGTAVEIDAIECVGTASAPPALSTLASSLLELEHWSPHRHRAADERGRCERLARAAHVPAARGHAVAAHLRADRRSGLCSCATRLEDQRLPRDRAHAARCRAPTS